MNESNRIDEVIALLQSDPELTNFLVAEPQAIVMPFAKEKEKRFLFVSIFIVQKACNFEVLASLCRRVVRILRLSGLLKGLDGVEIMPSTVIANQTKRILRLSIFADAIGRAEKISPAELQQTFPASPGMGMSCVLYNRHLR